MRKPSDASDPPSGTRPGADRTRRSTRWHTGVTRIEPNRILVRGYPVDELMGRVSFAESIYLLLTGELPGPAVGRMMEALLVSSLDHGTTPPSTLAARTVATTGAPLRASVAAGILSFGQYHGGDVEACLRLLEGGLTLVRQGESYPESAARILADFRATQATPPGFGHRFHSRDPRAARLFQMALELELDGEHLQMIRAVERLLANGHDDRPPLPVNVDGAIAAICGDLGLPPEIGNALFIVSRVPGLVTHALEERAREAPMRQIDPKDNIYDGSGERRVPERGT